MLCLLTKWRCPFLPVELVGLSDYREGELIVLLGDEAYRIAVSGLELERTSGLGAAAACAVD